MKKTTKTHPDDLKDSNTHLSEESCSSEKLGDVLSQLLSENKLSIHQLHKNTGIPLATIKRIKYDKNANPTISSLIPIANMFDITLNQLLGLAPLPAHHAESGYQEKRLFWKNIPIIKWEQINEMQDIKSSALEIVDFVSTDIEVSEQAFALIVQEDNWQLFARGTKLIFDPDKKPKHRNYVVIGNRDTGNTVFYQVLTFDGRCYLKPPQQEYKTIDFDKDKHIIKGTMVQARMDLE